MLNCAHDAVRWDERIARARELAAKHPTAAELLIFYMALAEYQKSLLDFTSVTDPFPPAPGPPEGGHHRAPGPPEGGHHRGYHRGYETESRSFFEVLDLEPVLAAVPDFLSWLQGVAPARLSESAAEMRRLDRAEWRHLAHSYLACNGRDFEADETQVFVLETLLQPFAEQLAIRIANSESRMASISARGALPPVGHPSAHKPRAGDPAAAAPSTGLGVPPPSSGRGRWLEDSLVAVAAGASPIPNPDTRIQGRCPICGGLPVVGVLREEGHGARRTLVCARCLTEREYLRVVCPACGEQQFDALPVYTADEFAHVRIEACDRCCRYLKTIDLTKDGLAVPPVDDIASVSLDLWARDRGYVRLRPSLLRI